ncbi:MAG: glyoxalase/bleomycin resistance/dioxygenase family protein [Rhodanobacter sp.]|nr:MAG: glyoxalase/bleomycin resistance/dioxygenase family protein [Rhodanobacter sp.]TAM08669.1 MAG: glyoxalase/bleomycin resistance/dioxygenase family protein [Rhodanobacter sp.]TAM36167.1 MAG: glyoxalase/bleomycin resistance/dioxygenase family protein [Rhodanobacter sp.]
MKRFHVHVNVNDLDASIRFYSTLFGSAPTVHKPDYAKWMLEDPRVNFAISQRGRAAGVDHLGMQAEDGAELEAIGARLMAADAVSLAEPDTTCCYAHSDKYWAEDPQGVRWETFHTHGEATTYSVPAAAADAAGSAACCGPQSSCCRPKASAAKADA